MGWLLDTCVLSEYVRRQPDPRVIAWLDAQDESELFVSRLTIAELQRGVFKAQAREPARGRKLAQWLARLVTRFEGRIHAVDAETLTLWAQLGAEAEREGQPIATIDALLMATALRNGHTVVTRNVADFARYPRVLNPWSDEGT